MKNVILTFSSEETQQTKKRFQILNVQDVKFNCCVVLQANVFSFIAANRKLTKIFSF
jgi:hypothetical protein